MRAIHILIINNALVKNNSKKYSYCFNILSDRVTSERTHKITIKLESRFSYMFLQYLLFFSLLQIVKNQEGIKILHEKLA